MEKGFSHVAGRATVKINDISFTTAENSVGYLAPSTWPLMCLFRHQNTLFCSSISVKLVPETQNIHC